MAMTKREYLAKEQILKKLNKEGYPTYSRLLDEFDVNLTKDPDVIAYMEPGKGRIVLNSGLDIEQVSTITRHEILHQYLDHEKRLLKHLANSEKLNYNKLSDMDIDELKNKLYSNQNFNIAGDYEISNRGYTDRDKRIARSIRLNGQTLKGLVTEDDHPDWVDLSVEQMYDKLNQQMQLDFQQIGQDQQNNKQDNKRNSSPQIGDKGDEQIQDAEQAEREANDISKEMQKAAATANTEADKENAEKVERNADKLADAAKDVKNQAQGEVFNDKSNDTSLNARLERIRRLLDDVSMQSKAVAEAENKVAKERSDKAARDADNYKYSPIKRFRDNLNKFIKNQIDVGRGQSWTRINKKYSDSGIIKPGSTRLAQTKVPLINVYFDRSGSWDDAKIQVGEQAVGTLNQYVQRHEIQIKLYYFSMHVYSTKEEATKEGGTRGQPILDHIEETKPDNVIVMTDSDINDCKSYVTVPGAVWFLFKGGRSQNLMEHLHGKAETKQFELD